MSNLVDIAKLIMGQSPPSSTYNDEGNGLPFYQGKTDFGFICPTIRKYCSSPSKVAESGDILISVRAPVGPVNIANNKCCIGRGIAAIRAYSFDQQFLYFNLISQEDYIASLGTGSTFKAINKSRLETLEIPDFPLPEQRKIAYV
ncbi:MAG: restriction endonuclease subunit S, partial [Sphingobacteriia bacterium]|nr:restriction endonuclease subunit S [Sphingobacteriia bacterium]